MRRRRCDCFRTAQVSVTTLLMMGNSMTYIFRALVQYNSFASWGWLDTSSRKSDIEVVADSSAQVIVLLEQADRALRKVHGGELVGRVHAARPAADDGHVAGHAGGMAGRRKERCEADQDKVVGAHADALRAVVG